MRESGHCFTLSNTLHTILFWRREWGGWRLCNFSVMNYFSHLFSVGNSLCKNHFKIKHRTWRGNYLIFPLNFPCPSFFQQILLSWIFCFGGEGGGGEINNSSPTLFPEKKNVSSLSTLCLLMSYLCRHEASSLLPLSMLLLPPLLLVLPRLLSLLQLQVLLDTSLRLLKWIDIGYFSK